MPPAAEAAAVRDIALVDRPVRGIGCECFGIAAREKPGSCTPVQTLTGLVHVRDFSVV